MIEIPNLKTDGTEEELAALERREVDEVWRLLVATGLPGGLLALIATHVLSAVSYSGLRHSRSALNRVGRGIDDAENKTQQVIAELESLAAPVLSALDDTTAAAFGRVLARAIVGK